MSQSIAIWTKESKEYHRLQAMAEFLTAETGVEHFVHETMFDAGQSWKWTTISRKDEIFGCVQILDPKQHLNIVFGSPEAWYDILKELLDKAGVL